MPPVKLSMQRVSGMETLKCSIIVEYRNTGPSREVIWFAQLLLAILVVSWGGQQSAMSSYNCDRRAEGAELSSGTGTLKRSVVISIDNLGVFIGSTIAAQYRTLSIRRERSSAGFLACGPPKIQHLHYLYTMIFLSMAWGLTCMRQLKNHFGHPTGNWHKHCQRSSLHCIRFGAKDLPQSRRH